MDEVGKVREKIDLVELISEHLTLKKAGRNFKTTCPFHREKTPSFVVSPERQIWHCFGCQKGGDCFSFLMEYEHLEFPEALRILALKAGITLSQFQHDTSAASKKEKMYLINRQAMEFYYYVLTQHPVGQKALTYLKKRGVRKGIIDTFMLGFSPLKGNALSVYLTNKKKHLKDDIVACGLANAKPAGLVDFFIGRIMFPLLDHRGNVLGFSGRVLNDSVDMAKYVNTRETPIYHKGNVFFGLNIAKDEIKKQNRALIMEGEFDVISAFQEGIGNAIAVKGTALTDDQVHLIARFCEKVSLCFDMDKAGQDAVKRSISALEKKDISATVVKTAGKDPDEAIRSNAGAFKKAVKNDIGIYDFLLEQTLSTTDKNSIEGKKRIGEEVLPLYAGIRNEIVKEHYLRKLARELDTSYESIYRESARVSKKELGTPATSQATKKKPREEMLEQYLLALIVQSANPKDAFVKVKQVLSGFSFTVPAYEKIVQELSTYFATVDALNHEKFTSLLPSELLSAFDTCYLFPLPLFEAQQYSEEIEKVASELKTIYVRLKIKALGEKIREQEKTGADKPLKKLQEEFSRLVSLLPTAQK